MLGNLKDLLIIVAIAIGVSGIVIFIASLIMAPRRESDDEEQMEFLQRYINQKGWTNKNDGSDKTED